MVKKILKENLLYIILMILVIVCFIVIKNTSLNLKVVEFDNKVINWFNLMHVNKFTSVMKVITNFGDWYIPIPIIVCIFLFFKNKWYFYLTSSSYLFAGIISFITKLLVARPRPIDALIKIPSSYSFPSGHTLTSIVFYITLCYLLSSKVKGIFRPILLFVVVLLITCIGLSRVYLGVHFFSDVMGGLLLGIVSELIVINTIKNNFKDKL